MCGIAGVFGKSDPATVDIMLHRLAHRGPDDHFVVSGESFTLGSRRLSIVDPEGGRQPLSNETGTVWACQNGELYNFPELRPQLENQGHRFHTRCDTEVLPHLYEDHDRNFAAQLRGMFAVALWDDSRQLGLLARDQTGKKPLYYLELGGRLFFASEIKSLLAVPGYNRRPNAASLHHFLSYKHVPAPQTAFEGIHSLEPAHVMVWRPGERPRIERFWDCSWASSPEWEDSSEEEIADRLIEVLTRAVERRLMSDVPIGFYLSGGVDSSLSTAIAATISPGKILTFTLAYDDRSTTEGKEMDRAWARDVSRRYQTEHHEEIVRVEDLATEFRTIQCSFDQPFSGVVAPFFLARLISRHVKVALSGDGADELFGSYLSHRLAPAIAAYLESEDEKGISANIRPLFDDNRGLVTEIADRRPDRWRAKLFVFSEDEKRRLYTPEFARLVGECSSEEHLASYFQRSTATDSLNRILEAEFRGIFPDQVLTFVDRLSMAHSLETRTAFLDPEFVQLAASLPERFKIRGRECKHILKVAARRYLPDGLIFRPKEGFVMPVNQWLNDGLREFTDELLSASRIRRAGVLRPKAVSDLLRRFRSGEVGLANKILSLLALQVWWEVYFESERLL